MRDTVMPLTDTAIRHAKATDKFRKLADEKSLYLLIHQAGKFSPSCLFFADEHQGCRGNPNQVLCHASNQHALEAASAVRADHEQVGIP
jgi:hypothetical protein